MKIAMVWPWGGAKKVRYLVKDGLATAMEIIGKKHQVDWYLSGDEPTDDYDWILVWGVSSVPFNFKIQKYKARKALMCAGHAEDIVNLRKFNVVFVESPLIFQHLKPHCNRIVLAFGVDTNFFKPLNIPKYIDAVYPATFSDWKRQDLFADAIGPRGLCFGVIQPDGVKHFEYCQQKQVATLSGLMPQSLMNIMYNVAKTCVITSWHGSERTVLEALACNVPVVVTNDNFLACSLLPNIGAISCKSESESIKKAFEKALTIKDNTREYVLENYTAEIYARKILEVIENDN
jgi:glycosyltransferase involved in cell wall biosynthesis